MSTVSCKAHGYGDARIVERHDKASVSGSERHAQAFVRLSRAHSQMCRAGLDQRHCDLVQHGTIPS
jgi:hypothetical protein